MIVMRLLSTAILALGLAISPVAAQPELKVAISTDIRGVMPGISPDDSTGTVLQHVFEGLVAWRGDGTVAPMLAKDVATTPDGKSYIFTLRDGVRFHNGAPLTSEEVVWTWRQFLGSDSKWPCAAHFNGKGLVKIESVEALDPARVRFSLAAPNASFLSIMARTDCDGTGIAHPDSVNADGEWKKAIGTGPFRLNEWRNGQFVLLEKFDGYLPRAEKSDGLSGLKTAKIDRIRFMIVPDPASVKFALAAGNLDFAGIDPSYAKELSANAGLDIVSSPVASINAVVMQTRDPLLGNVLIRRAINTAMNYEELAAAVTEGYAKPSTSPVPISSRYYGDIQKNGHVYDPAKVKALLAEAKYARQPIKITTNARFASMQDIALMMQGMGQAAGVNFQVEVVEFATQLARYFKGDYQLMVFNYTPYLDPALSFDRFIGSKAASPDKVWDNPEATALLAKLFETVEPSARQGVMDDLQRLFIADSPMMIWSSGVAVQARSKKIAGYEPWPGRRPRFWNVELK